MNELSLAASAELYEKLERLEWENGGNQPKKHISLHKIERFGCEVITVTYTENRVVKITKNW